MLPPSYVGRAEIAEKYHQYTIKQIKEKKTYILQHLSSGYTLSGLGLVHAIANSDELSVDVLETGPQCLFDRLLDLLLDETSSERTEGLVQEVVLRVADGELERINLDVDVVHLEDRRFVLGRCDEMNGGLKSAITRQ